MSVIVSGIRPSGDLHLGNYLGAMRQWTALQHEYACYLFIADLHALTTSYTPSEFQQTIQSTVAAYLAAGVDPEQCTIFVQSHIHEHAELAWLFETLTPVGALQRMHQYKEKSQKQKSVNAALLVYPVLQAADVLLYKANHVPIGEDQAQHLELTRELSRRFNTQFGTTFPEPASMIPKQSARIMSLQNPAAKMSKSDASNAYISLFDTPKDIHEKIRAAVTDTGNTITYAPDRKPGISNLLCIYSHFSETPINELEKRFEGKGYAELKHELAESLSDKLAHFRHKKRELSQRSGHIEELLDHGAQNAQHQAQETMEEVRSKMGLSSPR